MSLAVVVSALGYFVDIFDLYLFGVVRVASLKDLGIQGDRLLEVGISLLNRQMLGVLLGGIFWGVLGDKVGRVSVLFASIFLYSAANIANAFVQSVEAYGWLRLIAGFGLAGELGLAITLVSETLPKSKRGYGTTLVASVGLCGSIAAAIVAERLHWRSAFLVGGALGFVLLFLRFRLTESPLYSSLEERSPRGDFLKVFSSHRRGLRYLALILIGVPIWVTVGIGVTFAPEFAKELEIKGIVTAGRAIFFTYIGVALGDLISGFWSQRAKSRKKILIIFLTLLGAFMAIYLNLKNTSVFWFYCVSTLLGFATGYWAVFMTYTAEQFGTNLRSTVTTTVPNFVRGAVVPATLLFQYLKPQLGLMGAMAILTIVSIALAVVSIRSLEETAERDLDFIENY